MNTLLIYFYKFWSLIVSLTMATIHFLMVSESVNSLILFAKALDTGRKATIALSWSLHSTLFKHCNSQL